MLILCDLCSNFVGKQTQLRAPDELLACIGYPVMVGTFMIKEDN